MSQPPDPLEVSLRHVAETDASGDRESGLTISFSVGVGYRRRRPDTRGDRWEARVDSIGLLIVSSIIVALIVVIALPRILHWLGAL